MADSPIPASRKVPATPTDSLAPKSKKKPTKSKKKSRNAFGVGSPSWNTPFPIGNLTAAEILAYLPHWLKSVDVVDRFIANGGRSHTVAVIINDHRNLPKDKVFNSNSAQIMMSYGMRRAGFKGWKVGTHHEFTRPDPSMREDDLDVQDFRTPRETHPKKAPSKTPTGLLKVNVEADPIDFKDLALHVKKHPGGNDALDLARCVAYALTHQEETWMFPTDFELLVNKLGGPATITSQHHDRQIFNRREKAKLATSSTLPAAPSPLKRMVSAEDLEEVGERRKSDRLASRPSKDFREYGSDIADDVEPLLSPFTTPPPSKKRKYTRSPATPASPSDDNDFEQEEADYDDEEEPEAEDESDDQPISPEPAIRGRAAAQKARQAIRSMSTETERNIEALTRQMSVVPQTGHMPPPPIPRPAVEVSQEMMALARGFSERQSIFIKPPVLSTNRLRVDASTVFLYAAEGCTSMKELWNSALSSTRFNGPRRSPPFRELHRLTDPPSTDVSDWAENIRWAKEQHALFGSDSWTEYDYHLDMITEHRRLSFWVSEEAITGGL
ncbi:hypothetical protein IQ06DRAFT_367491 [Phaeosphaeriaceae sp. SRC1lsM3a]|nr:hypothetical protein IQ06DRAFT_367491 [Stagonospora sp. SRC1lsM3a]